MGVRRGNGEPGHERHLDPEVRLVRDHGRGDCPRRVHYGLQRHAPDAPGAAAAQVRQRLQGRFFQKRQWCTRGGGRLPQKAQEHPRRRAVLPSALHGRW